jgi:hypothetical protein
VEKQYDTSMFLFEIAGVSVGYFAYRYIGERYAEKKATKGRELK